ncbi:glycosyltransferase family 25 protein [Pseudotabrizicola sediminis]|uniref:Glycosyltransferase family 25 protein n=1 Tax=Pseudotabrizicola sediminis TaxID=2486418 RepID=A0ABY2KGM5_9RHOB|nr:glycosyltransferase family 25 protein [Pseudotabrizicola sediminis]TGD41349.1 glycosyltransferase family 25 protein [Pseudotabrizicola sediminis]
MKVEDIGVWLINLPTDVGRRSAMEHQLTKLGLSWQLFPAIDGRARRDELLKGADEAAYQRNMGMSLLPGKLGVYASHLAVWEAFIASDHDVAMILEDDVVFHDDFLEALATALAGREHWDLVRFNAIRAKLPVTQGTLGNYRLNAYVGPFTGNACYLIKKDVARKLVSELWPQTRALDHELNRFFVHDYRQRGLEPFASHPDDQNVSTITGVGFAKVKKFKWYRRLPHYQLKAVNYLRRFFYLVRTGAFPGRRAPLSIRDE